MKHTAIQPALILSRCNSFGLLLGQRLHELPRGPTPVRIVDIGDELFGYLVDDLQRPPQQFSFVTAETIENQESGETIGYRVLLFLVDSAIDHRPEIAGHIHRFTASPELGQRGLVRLLPKRVRGHHRATTEAAPVIPAEDAETKESRLDTPRALIFKNSENLLPLSVLLLPQPLLKKSGLTQAALLRLSHQNFASLDSKNEVRGNLPTIRMSFLRHKIAKDRNYHAQTVRTRYGERQGKLNRRHFNVADCAHNAHTVRNSPHLNMTSDSATRGYAHGKKRTNVSLNGDLVKWAIKHFRKTSYGSMSNAFDAYLRGLKCQEARKAANSKKPPTQ
jgi:hypothetical protein